MKLNETHVISLDIKVGEIDGDPELRRRQNLPDAILVRGIQFWERGRSDGSIGRFDKAPAGICNN